MKILPGVDQSFNHFTISRINGLVMDFMDLARQ